VTRYLRIFRTCDTIYGAAGVEKPRRQFAW
jgi:hypothetical protein